MASSTPNLGLLKKDPVTDGADTFNIETMLNENWDKVDEAVGNKADTGHTHDDRYYTEAEVNAKFNAITNATQSSDGYMSKEDKTKMDGVADDANNYTHPLNHPATIITEDTTHRFVTDAEKSAWNALDSSVQKLMIRDLQIMLNQTLSTSNIDAWADLLNDDSRLNTGASSNYKVENGGASFSSVAIFSIPITNVTNTDYVGHSTTLQKQGQTFVATATTEVTSIDVNLLKTGNPTDGVRLKVTKSGTSTPAYTSDIVQGSEISTTASLIKFTFTDLNVTLGEKYFVEISRTGGLNSENYFRCTSEATSYIEGAKWRYDGTTWIESETYDIHMAVYGKPTSSIATLVWKSVVASETIKKMAVCTNETLNTGIVKYYVSDNGSSWTQVTTANAIQSVVFASANVYLKVEITGDAVLNGIAWGGY